MAETASERSLELDATSVQAAVVEGARRLGVDAARLRAEVVAEERSGDQSGDEPRLRVRLEVKPEPERDGRWVAAYFNDALQLIVSAPVGGGAPVGHAPIAKILRAMGLEPEHEDWFEEKIAAAAAAVFAVPTEAFGPDAGSNFVTEGTAVLVVQPDRLAAWLVAASFNPKRPMQSADITAVLASVGVTEGRDDALIQRLDGRLVVHPVVVARGRPPVNGEDADIEICVGDREGEANDVPTRPDAQVDFRKASRTSYVTVGDLLMRKIPATQGVSGVSVFGNKLPATDGADADLTNFAGENTEVVKLDGVAGTGIRATAAGNVNHGANKIDVEPALEIPGNVDFGVGNIDFPGPVTVRGGIESGFEVKAAGDIDVIGNVQGATAIATGNVLIGGGFLGEADGHDGRIEAGGSVGLAFAEGGAIYARGDVTVSRELVRTTVHTAGSIFVEGEGKVRGATLVAVGDVRAGVIGGRLGANTLVVAGSRLNADELGALMRGEAGGGATVAPTDDGPESDTSGADGGSVENSDASTDDPEAAADASARAPRIIVLDHVEPGVRLVVGSAQVRTEQTLAACQLIEGEGVLVLLPVDRR